MIDYFFKIINNNKLRNLPHSYKNYNVYKNQLQELKGKSITLLKTENIFNIIRKSKHFELYKNIVMRINLNYIYPSNIHGIAHNLRTSLYSFYLCSVLKLNKDAIKISTLAALYHDIGRINDSDDFKHGYRGAKLLPNLKLDVTKEELKILQTIITAHSLPDKKFELICKSYNIKNNKLCEVLFKILKDSDGIDRVRLPSARVNLDFIRLKHSKQLIPFSYCLEYNFYKKMQLNLKNLNCKKISRKKLFDLEGKYIFHGSPNLFNLCHPHKAHCGTKIKANQKFAVYGTSNINLAICFSFAKGSLNWRVEEQNGIYIAHILNQAKFSNSKVGYLYCFDKNKFKLTQKQNIQYYSKEVVLPLKIFKIYYKNYKDFFCFQNQRSLYMTTF